MSLNDTIATFVEDTTIAHEIVHGDATTTVETENGPVRSLAKLIADNQAVIDEQLPNFEAIANATSEDAGPLTGAESLPVSRGAGLLQTTFQKLAIWILTLICPQVATFASLPASPTGFYLVLADETKSGAPTIYFFTTSHRYWVAMVQDA